MALELNNPVLLVLLAGVLVNLILTVFLLWQRFKDKKSGEPEDDEADLRALIARQKKTLTSHNKNLVEIGKLLEELVENNKLNIQRVGLVRFNPFAETGGNMSFALALLDGRDNGIVISSLHSREGTRIYVKSIEHGLSKSPLTGEEQEAIDKSKIKN